MDGYEKKLFWLIWFVVGIPAYWMPLVLGVVWTIVMMFVSWWIVYRSGMI